MIIAYAGRRAASLSEGAEQNVALRVQRLVTALRPSAVVGGAADGGDLLVLEAALRTRRATPRVVLPTPAADFREASVEDGWRDRHDRALERARDAGEVETIDLEDGADAYRAANRRMVELARELAGAGERAVALVVASPGAGEMVEDLAERAGLAGMPVLRIDPGVDTSARKQCFVAMPFGSKYDPQRKITLDCDQFYERVLVPALENAQLGYRRADEQIDSGVVLQPMIEALSEADVVIADLSTGNFNVGWELGLRHLLRSRHTLLALPAGTSPPFDVASLRHVVYEHDDRGVSDDAAVAGWAAIGRFLDQLDAGPGSGDSPVEGVMDVERWAALAPRSPRDESWERLRERLALARDLRDAGLMLRTVEEAAGLDAERRSLVEAEAGVGLVRLGAHREGAALLRDVVAADPRGVRTEAHVSYAQALYKPVDAPDHDLDAAERVIRDLLVNRPDHPELWAGLGAISKRRSRRRGVDERRRDIAAAMVAYAHDYERDLGAYYEGVNLVACGLLLEVAFGDEAAGARARRTLPAVALAAQLALRRNPGDYWAAVTLAEVRLHEALLGFQTTPQEAVAAYREAGERRPPHGWVNSSLTQLRWLIEQGVLPPWLAEAGRELAAAAGCPELAKDLS